ncbi:MAG: wax ester/triacylglycerol synthase family O-acyltransferase [Nocardioidaceae bacterium]
MGTTTQRLTGLDAAFLALDTEHSTGHVGGVSVFDPSSAPEPLDLERVLRVYEERLPLVPVLRRRLVSLPWGVDQPYWVDDPDFDLRYHVREGALPAPGTQAQLAAYVARLHERPLDLTRPLWEAYVITGLEGGRVAAYIKIHHAAMDGVSGNDLIGALMDVDPAGRPLPPATPWDPPPLPTPWRMVGRAAGDLARRPVEAARIAADAARAVPGVLPWAGPLVGRLLGRGSPDGELIEANAGRAPQTPLNQDITPHRRLGLASLSLEQVKTVKAAFGVTVNDVVMAVCAGAIRSWLVRHRGLPDHPLVAMVPVSIRTARGDGGELGNKVSAMLAQLPTHLADPVERLRVSHEATRHAKSQQAFIPQGLVDEVMSFTAPALMSRGFRAVFGWHVLNRVPMFNVVISNIPGPQVPIYFCGATLLAHYPVSIITDGLALNITVISYQGELHFGLLADRKIVPDVDRLAADLQVELDALLAAAGA